MGISLFVPLLNFFVEKNAETQYSKYFRLGFDFLGIPFTLQNLLWVLIGVFFMKTVISIGVFYYRENIRESLKIKLHSLFIVNLCNSDYPWFKNIKESELNNALTLEIDKIVDACTKLGMIISATFNLFIYGISFLLINDVKTLAFMLPAFVILPFLLKFSKKIRKGSRLSTQINEEVQDNIFQLLRGFKYLKVKQSFEVFHKRLFDLFEMRRKTSVKIYLMVASPTALTEFLAVSLASLFIWLFVMKMNKPLAEVLVIIILIQRLFTNMINYITSKNSFWANIGSLDKYYSFLSEMEKHEDLKIKIKTSPITFNHETILEFENVSFLYHDQPVLNNVSLKIKRGEKIGIVGLSGSGKSTMFDLALGLLHPQTGKVLLDGIDITKISRQDIANVVGFVPQDPVIFNDTAERNLFWFKKSHIDLPSELNKHILKFLTQFSTERVGDTYRSMSGGQRQKIAFLRELIQDTKLLFIDEGTSSMDTQSEKEFMELTNISKDVSIVMIAHRLSSLTNCDRILVLNNGTIIEQGDWKSLANDSDSFFSSLLRQQSIN